MLRTVRFLHKVPPYRTGETAGFSRDEAQRLIDLGAAEPVKPDKGGYQNKAMDQPPANRAMQPRGRRKKG